MTAREKKAFLIELQGWVTGVNMRRFVSHLAGRYNLTGKVRNESSELVSVFVEGDEKDLLGFLQELSESPERPGRVDNLVCKPAQPVQGSDRFVIEP